MYESFFADADMFIKIMQIGSIMATSEQTGEHRSTISRRIQRLEDYFQHSLISTKSGRVVLTEYGSQVLPRLIELSLHTNAKIERLTQRVENKNMRIRLLNNVGIYYYFGVPFIANLQKALPKVSFELNSYTFYQMVNFGSISKSLFDQFDIIFLHADLLYLIDSDDWIVKRSFDTYSRLYALQAYVENNPSINKLEDLENHCCIYDHLYPNKIWSFYDDKGHNHAVSLDRTLAVDTVLIQAQLTREGFGVAYLPESIALYEKKPLIHILPEYASRVMTTYFLVNTRSYKQAIMQQSVDIIQSVLDKVLIWKH